jgi:hypothetical protein
VSFYLGLQKVFDELKREGFCTGSVREGRDVLFMSKMEQDRDAVVFIPRVAREG